MRKLITSIIILVIISCGVNAESNKTEGPYLVLYAFSAEGELIADIMQDEKVEIQLGREVRIGKFANKQIVLAESGVGMTNAAMSVQRMIDIYHPRAVIMTGIAGAVDNSVRIGDVVVCDKWIQHDYYYIGNECKHLRPISAYDPTNNKIAIFSSFPVDSSLLMIGHTLNSAEMKLNDIDGRLPVLHIGGTGVSGNAFIDSKTKRANLVSDFIALITDMESAAVAHVCHVNDIPVIIFRSASDLAGGSDSESARDEMDQFFQIAADNSAKILERFLEKVE
jgi:adenosylhomocysteine nucleosidase